MERQLKPPQGGGAVGAKAVGTHTAAAWCREGGQPGTLHEHLQDAILCDTFTVGDIQPAHGTRALLQGLVSNKAS